MRTAFKTATGALAFSALLHAGASAQCLAPSTVDGKWTANDHGTYYVRQMGNEFIWVGLSSDDGKTFTSVFRGTRQGSTVTGTWADVRGPHPTGTGSLTLTLEGTSLMIKKSESGAVFGASRWGRGGCNDTR